MTDGAAQQGETFVANTRVRVLAGVLTIGLLVLVLTGGAPSLLGRRAPGQVRARVAAMAGGQEGYARATGPVPIEFPRDHGPHPDYQTEWWYYTGNLDTAEGRHFGYQLTFFRRALVPPSGRQGRASAWGTGQAYMAHFALADVDGRRFRSFERLGRGAAGLAGASAAPYQVWLDEWSVQEQGPGTVRLRTAQDGLALDLVLADAKGPVLHGEQGYSQKGPDPGSASYYYSQTRLETSGRVQVGGDWLAVTGLSWMDHEWSTSSLSAGQVGWDWFSIQMDDGSELMVFQLRREDGGIDPFSSGTLVLPDGSTRPLGEDEFRIEAQDTWTSPETGAAYPAGWSVSVPAQGLELEIAPYLANQELSVSYAYWEGAVRVRGTRQGRPVAGSGYVELTGYAGSMAGQF